MSEVTYPSPIKTARPDAEPRELKILKERLWHFTSVGLGNCRAAQQVRREIQLFTEASKENKGFGQGNDYQRNHSSRRLVRHSLGDGGSFRPKADSPDSSSGGNPLANQSIEQLTAGLSHLVSVGMANSRAAEKISRELSRQLFIQSALLANANFNPDEPRDRRGQWTKEGNTAASATNKFNQPITRLAVGAPASGHGAIMANKPTQFITEVADTLGNKTNGAGTNHPTQTNSMSADPTIKIQLNPLEKAEMETGISDPEHESFEQWLTPERQAYYEQLMQPVIRAFTPWEKFIFDLRQLMFKWLPGTRPDGYPPPWKVMGGAFMLLPFGIGPETRLGKLLLAYFAAKTAADQPAYYRAIKQELQTGNYSDASRNAAADLLNIGMIGAGIHGAVAGGGLKGPGAGEVPAESTEIESRESETGNSESRPASQDRKTETPQPLSATGGKTGSGNDYRATFFAAHPELRGKVIVHHAIEQQVINRYPGVMTEAEIHSLGNLRGVPNDANAKVHLSNIRKEWNAFYREHPTSVTKEQLFDKAREIDKKFGQHFNPPASGGN